MFKAGVGRDEARRGRNETQVQIRKEKKEERLNQRRRKGGDAGALGAFSFGAIPEGGAPVAGTTTAADAANHMRVGGGASWFVALTTVLCGGSFLAGVKTFGKSEKKCVRLSFCFLSHNGQCIFSWMKGVE